MTGFIQGRSAAQLGGC